MAGYTDPLRCYSSASAAGLAAAFFSPSASRSSSLGSAGCGASMPVCTGGRSGSSRMAMVISPAAISRSSDALVSRASAFVDAAAAVINGQYGRTVGQHQVLEAQLPVDTKMRGRVSGEERSPVCGRYFNVIARGDDELLVDYHVVRNLDVRAICDGFPERRWRRHRYRRVRGRQWKQPYEESTHRCRFRVRCRNFCPVWRGGARALVGSLVSYPYIDALT